MKKVKKSKIRPIIPAKENLRNHQKPPKNSRLMLFRIIAILFSIVFVLLIELLFRVFGYGHDLSLFTESQKDPSFWEMSRYASYKFFTDEENTTHGYNEPFKKDKEADSYRIFVLGESTTVGFPYMHNGSFHRWLKYRLMYSFPDKNFEIINLSLTAVNSYTIYDFAQEIVKYQPDAVLIYVGHNEYYGALGVGSTSRIGSNPVLVRSVLELKNLRLFQFMNNSINGIRRNLSGIEIDTTKSLMFRMPADREIPLESKEYYAGIKQFHDNIDKTLDILSSHNIPVLLSNLVSNERDLVPFISDTVHKENSAVYQFKLAKESYNLGDYLNAKELFIKAKELDLLRFRAPEAINDEILNLSKKYPGVFYVDSRSYFAENSPHGIIGNETLLEHLHPNLFGYALLSDAFFECLKKNKFINEEWNNAMSFQELLQEMPITVIDSLRGVYTVKFMKNTWPFTNTPIETKELIKWETEIEKITFELVFEKITWNNAIMQLGEIYNKSGDKEGGLKFAEAIALEFPFSEQSYKSAAASSLRLGNKKKAVFYIRKGFRINPNFSAARQLTQIYLELDEPDKAIEFLIFMSSSKENKSNLSPIIDITKEIIKLKGKIYENGITVELYNGIALNYLKIGQLAMARKYASEAIQIDKYNTNSNLLLVKIAEVEKSYLKLQE